MSNTGMKAFSLLVEINNRTGEPTGRTKPNVPEDPDYIPPVSDLSACPTPEEFSDEFSPEYS